MTREEYYAKYPHRNIHDKAFDPAKHPRFREHVWNRLPRVNEDGSLNTDDSILYELEEAIGKYGEGHDQFAPDTSDGSEDEDILLSDLYDQGIITQQPDSFEVNIPAFVAKKFDPYYKDYFKTGNAVLDRVSALEELNDGGEDTRKYIWSYLSKLFNLRGLLNLHKIANDKDFYEAIVEASQFNEDFPGYEGQFNSLNELRAAPAKIAEENERKQDLENAVELIYSDLLNKKVTFNDAQISVFKNAGNSYEGSKRIVDDPAFEDLRNQYVEKVKAQRQSPYDKLTAETKKLAEANGWKVLSSPQELKDTGVKLRHCYGDTKTYGDSHHKEYSRRCRNVNTVLVTNGEVTAEVIVEPDSPKPVKVGQVMAYNNKPVRLDDPAVKGLDEIVIGLNNMTQQEISSKDMKIIHDVLTRGKDLGL